MLPSSVEKHAVVKVEILKGAVFVSLVLSGRFYFSGPSLENVNVSTGVLESKAAIWDLM